MAKMNEIKGRTLLPKKTTGGGLLVQIIREDIIVGVDILVTFWSGVQDVVRRRMEEEEGGGGWQVVLTRESPIFLRSP
jgi:hypothetical protein